MKSIGRMLKKKKEKGRKEGREREKKGERGREEGKENNE